MSRRKLYVIIGLIVLAAFTRLIPHPYNFTAVGAMALFGGAMIKPRALAFLLPLLAMLISDIFLPPHSNMFAVYISFMIITLLGIWVGRNRSVGRVIAGSLTGSFLFFLITNFAVWMGSATYPQDLSGLIACYTMALPFYESSIFGNLVLNSIVGDLFYNTILFGSLYAIEVKYPTLLKANN